MTAPGAHVARTGWAQKRATGQTDEQMILDALDRAGVTGATAHEIDRQYGWASRSGSPAGRRLSELRHPAYLPAERRFHRRVLRLRAKRDGCHIHVKREHYDRDIHGETAP